MTETEYVMQFPDGIRLRVMAGGQEIYSGVRVASSFLSRLRGLLGHAPLEDGEGLLIIPCDAIHMFFMTFAIDAVFMDETGRVVRIYRNLRPWRITPVVPGAWMVLEVKAGSADDLSEGDVLSFERG